MIKKFVLALLLLAACTALLTAQLQNSIDIMTKGHELVGTPYVYGGDTLGGFDCSGLVFFLYKPYISDIGRTVTALIDQSTPVSREQLQPGDLIFYATGSDSSPTHVSIYVGDNNNLHAISQGVNKGVNITSLDSNYWKKRVLYYRRVLNILEFEEAVLVDGEVPEGAFCEKK